MGSRASSLGAKHTGDRLFHIAIRTEVPGAVLHICMSVFRRVHVMKMFNFDFGA